MQNRYILSYFVRTCKDRINTFLILTDEAAAVDMGQQLIDRSISVAISPGHVFTNADDAFYRLMEDDDSTALNIGEHIVCGTPKRGQLTRRLFRI